MKNKLRHPISKALGAKIWWSERRADGSRQLTFLNYEHDYSKAAVEAILYRAGIPVQKIRVYRWYIKIRTQEPV